MAGRGRVALRRPGLDLPVQELPADALELVGDRQLVGGQVDILPPQAQHFTTAQPEDQDQHVRGVERVAVGTGRLQELANLVDGPRRRASITPGLSPTEEA